MPCVWQHKPREACCQIDGGGLALCLVKAQPWDEGLYGGTLVKKNRGRYGLGNRSET
jgi:hypothetical protein